MTDCRAVRFCADESILTLIDQRALPTTFSLLTYNTVDGVADAIQTMVVRGAPAIGATGAFGMAIAASSCADSDSNEDIISALSDAKDALDASRPTAGDIEECSQQPPLNDTVVVSFASEFELGNYPHVGIGKVHSKLWR